MLVNDDVAQDTQSASLLVIVSLDDEDQEVLVRVSSGGQQLTRSWTISKSLRGDFNGDGEVTFSDFVDFARVWGKRLGDAEYDAKYDLSGNDIVDFGDFVEFARYFGL